MSATRFVEHRLHPSGCDVLSAKSRGDARLARSPRRISALLGVAMLLAPATRAQAQDAEATSAAARRLFNQGVELADHEQWPAAVVRFRHALTLRESSVILFNLAVALGHEGHPVEAAELFRRVIRSPSSDAALREEATRALAVVEPRIAWADVSFAASSAGLTLAVDGADRSIALLGGSLPLDPGSHEITLAHAGHVVARAGLTVAPGAHATLRLEVIAGSEDELARPEHDRAPSVSPELAVALSTADAPRDDTTLWIGLGVGGGIVLVAGVIVLAVVLVPPSEPNPYSGGLGTVEVGR